MYNINNSLLVKTWSGVFVLLLNFSFDFFIEENAEESLAISVVQKEKDLLQGLIHNVLPHVGSSVKTIVLAYSSAISNKMVSLYQNE